MVRKLIKWERIAKIEEMKPTSNYVYDFSVPGTQAFGNVEGIFVHNSVTADAHRWASAQNKAMGWMTETFRYKGYIVIFCLPDLSMLDSRIRKVTHSVTICRGEPGEEARVYKLKATHLGSQRLKGLGIIDRYPLPCVEKCQRKSCRRPKQCLQYHSCTLLRGEYERKKEEGFELLRQYCESKVKNATGGITPYTPFGSGSSIPEDLPEDLQIQMTQPTQPTNQVPTQKQTTKKLKLKHEYGEDVI